MKYVVAMKVLTKNKETICKKEIIIQFNIVYISRGSMHYCVSTIDVVLRCAITSPTQSLRYKTIEIKIKVDIFKRRYVYRILVRQ